jgi:hypothetical protein
MEINTDSVSILHSTVLKSELLMLQNSKELKEEETIRNWLETRIAGLGSS